MSNYGILSIRPTQKEFEESFNHLISYNWGKFFSKYIITKERTSLDEPWSHLHIAFELLPTIPDKTDNRRKIIITRNKDIPKFKEMTIAYNIKYGKPNTTFINSCVYVMKDANVDNSLGFCIKKHNISDTDLEKINNEIITYKNKKDQDKEEFHISGMKEYIPLLYKEFIKLENINSYADVENPNNEIEYKRFALARNEVAKKGIFTMCKSETLQFFLQQYIIYKRYQGSEKMSDCQDK